VRSWASWARTGLGSTVKSDTAVKAPVNTVTAIFIELPSQFSFDGGYALVGAVKAPMQRRAAERPRGAVWSFAAESFQGGTLGYISSQERRGYALGGLFEALLTDRKAQ